MSNIRMDFIKAKDILTTHKGRIKERLIAAGRTGIAIYDEKKLPEHLQEDYKYLVTKLTQENDNVIGDGSIEQTVNGISEDEAAEIAGLIMNFASDLLKTPRSEFD